MAKSTTGSSKSAGKGKKPALKGQALAVTRGKGKKKGLKKRGY